VAPWEAVAESKVSRNEDELKLWPEGEAGAAISAERFGACSATAGFSAPKPHRPRIEARRNCHVLTSF
jgi:hypothetical protein